MADEAWLATIAGGRYCAHTWWVSWGPYALTPIHAQYRPQSFPGTGGFNDRRSRAFTLHEGVRWPVARPRVDPLPSYGEARSDVWLDSNQLLVATALSQ